MPFKISKLLDFICSDCIFCPKPEEEEKLFYFFYPDFERNSYWTDTWLSENYFFFFCIEKLIFAPKKESPNVKNSFITWEKSGFR